LAKAAAILAAEPGDVARAVHPLLASTLPHEALAVLIGYCAETPVDLWATARLRGELERTAWAEPVASVGAGGSAHIVDLPLAVYSAGSGSAGVDVVVLSHRPPTAEQDVLMARSPSWWPRALSSRAGSRPLRRWRRRGRSPASAAAWPRRCRVVSRRRSSRSAAARAEADFAESTAASVLARLEEELAPMAERHGVRPEFHLDGEGEAAVAQAGAYIARSAVLKRLRARQRRTGSRCLEARAGRTGDHVCGRRHGLRCLSRGWAGAAGDAQPRGGRGRGPRGGLLSRLGDQRRARLPTEAVESSGEARRARELVARLGEREREVLALIADGMRNRDVAAALQLSPHTVKTHLANIMSKLEANTRVEATRIWTMARFDDAGTGPSCALPPTD
jgi:RNA polymerase sigma factor (sigma-70 family)